VRGTVKVVRSHDCFVLRACLQFNHNASTQAKTGITNVFRSKFNL